MNLVICREMDANYRLCLGKLQKLPSEFTQFQSKRLQSADHICKALQKKRKSNRKTEAGEIALNNRRSGEKRDGMGEKRVAASSSKMGEWCRRFRSGGWFSKDRSGEKRDGTGEKKDGTARGKKWLTLKF
ncbi:hypothetical protein LXL04_034766 [Taraxacum kok-saghyz]